MCIKKLTCLFDLLFQNDVVTYQGLPSSQCLPSFHRSWSVLSAMDSSRKRQCCLVVQSTSVRTAAGLSSNCRGKLVPSVTRMLRRTTWFPIECCETRRRNSGSASRLKNHRIFSFTCNCVILLKLLSLFIFLDLLIIINFYINKNYIDLKRPHPLEYRMVGV